MECPHFKSHETKPLHSQHQLARQLMSTAINFDPPTHYDTIGSPNIDQLPSHSARVITQHFLTERRQRNVPSPNPQDLHYSEAFLQRGIADSFILFQSATSSRDVQKLAATLQHEDTIASVAHLAKHEGETFYALLRDSFAYRSVIDSGIRTFNDEPTTSAGCPEVTRMPDQGDTQAVPTQLFGRFVLWTGRLYTEMQYHNQTAHARKE